MMRQDIYMWKCDTLVFARAVEVAFKNPRFLGFLKNLK